MDWLAKYWWILVLVFLVGVLLNVIKDLKRVDHKKFLANKPELPRIVILTINGMTTTIGQTRINRRRKNAGRMAVSHRHPACELNHLNHIIIVRLTAAQRFIKVVLRYGKTQVVERKLHTAFINGVPQIFDDIQRHIPTGTY